MTRDAAARDGKTATREAAARNGSTICTSACAGHFGSFGYAVYLSVDRGAVDGCRAGGLCCRAVWRGKPTAIWIDCINFVADRAVALCH